MSSALLPFLREIAFEIFTASITQTTHATDTAPFSNRPCSVASVGTYAPNNGHRAAASAYGTKQISANRKRYRIPPVYQPARTKPCSQNPIAANVGAVISLA